MEYLLSGTEMSAADQYTQNVIGIPGMVLMERAALATAEEIAARLPAKRQGRRSRVWIAAGGGSNGGDGLAVGRLLLERGYEVSITVLRSGGPPGSLFERQRRILAQLCIPCGRADAETLDGIPAGVPDAVVDAIFGTGFSRTPAGLAAAMIEAVNECRERGAVVFAVDIPSGVRAGNGEIPGAAVQADITVTYGFRKLGQLLYPGASACGEVILRDIGIPGAAVRGVTEDGRPGGRSVQPCFTMDRQDISALLLRRGDFHKGNYGKVLFLAGSRGMAGAALLCAAAAFRSGAGMVRLVTPEENRAVLQAALPEATLHSYDGKIGRSREARERFYEALREDVDWADCIAAGPGIGRNEVSAKALRAILELVDEPAFSGKTLVADADALYFLASDPGLFSLLAQRPESVSLILTPHPGEYAALTGRDISEAAAYGDAGEEALVSQLHAVLVRKNARTRITEEKGGRFLVSAGNDGMATAGSGDVLSGITAAVCARLRQLAGNGRPDDMLPAEFNGSRAFAAACAAAQLHALAGDAAAERLGRDFMKAGDIAESLRVW
ncbi:NAD(P)H-hydrate dehydratase [Lachnoclostridium sp. Marseille-P6806]|uniref:NAD(P)H-hydrate dehydratase n=1 Tax=Lachnoclostridium sp. Marseille-P6806 TaxID=2364793 RepID=UPI0013EF0D38|nr:NAD(P)H-hydrate dehydratase [Lachnoclostridium sp. Marseille-P6806]